ncbi:MAG: selenocysteine-specific translation elongation factor [Vulcanimicrobiota bacterium]
MAHYIVGTAGHVDHGKSTLIRALTGTETDRLPEEQARGLSIDLGFASLELDRGVTAGIVDVPGHERFLKNMLAGVGGYDLGLLVVDAQESVMPQTTEHVEILDLLKTRAGVVALTKVDLAEEEFLELVEEELAQALAPTFLHQAPVVRVSARTGRGMDELKKVLAERLAGLAPRSVDAPFRLPVDRVFLKSGFGTVVTGSLWSGTLNVGDRVEILPAGIEARIRGLQVHGAKVEQALAGQRVAVNFSGVEPGSLARGQVLAPPGLMRATTCIDARLEVLASVPRALKHRAPVRFYAGTQECIGRVYLLEQDRLEAGRSGLVQIRLEEPTVVLRQDRYILREFTSSFTVGGGTVLDPYSAPYRRRSDPKLLNRLKDREQGGTEGGLLAVLESAAGGTRTAQALAQELQLDEATFDELVQRLLAEGAVARLGKWYASGPAAQALSARLESVLERLQEAAPWRVGWRKEELLKLLNSDKPQLAQAVLADGLARGRLQERQALLSLAGHEAVLDPEQRKACDRVVELLRSGGCAPPDWKELEKQAGLPPRMWNVVAGFLIETQAVKKVAEGMYFLEETLEAARQALRELGDGFTASEARTALDTTRKYIIPVLEYFDLTGFTQRVDDKRVVRT